MCERQLRGIAGIAQLLELDAFNDASGSHVKTGNNALARHAVPDALGFGVLGWSGSEGTEILQNFQSGFGGFLRMKLHPEDIVPLHSGRKRSAIICASRSLVDYRRAVGVGVIDKRAAVHTLQQARTRANFQLVPAHMRRLY